MGTGWAWGGFPTRPGIFIIFFKVRMRLYDYES